MLFGDFMYPTVRFGAVFRNQESYDAVRCGLAHASHKAYIILLLKIVDDAKSHTIIIQKSKAINSGIERRHGTTDEAVREREQEAGRAGGL